MHTLVFGHRPLLPLYPYKFCSPILSLCAISRLQDLIKPSLAEPAVTCVEVRCVQSHDTSTSRSRPHHKCREQRPHVDVSVCMDRESHSVMAHKGNRAETRGTACSKTTVVTLCLRMIDFAVDSYLDTTY